MMSNQDPVRWIHNIVARSKNQAEASTRPSDTYGFEIHLMIRDVIRKLELQPRHSILEIGCGTGVLGLPLARKTARYVGIDFADASLDVFHQRLERTGLTTKASLAEIDMSTATAEQLGPFANFDRAVMYAVLHYAKSDAEGVRFLTAAVRSLRPNGVALIGNLPLRDLAEDVTSKWLRPMPRLQRISRYVRWVFDHDSAFGRTRRWKAAAGAYFFSKNILNRVRKDASFQTASLPPGVVVPLSRGRIEGWLAEVPYRFRYEWLAPAVAIPLYLTRADLRIVREE